MSIVLSFIAGTGIASAHPEPAILQAGGAEKRVPIAGATYAAENGVGVYRGRLKLLGEETARSEYRAPTMAAITINVQAWRPMRGLRTHGFYSGDPYPSRRYTQGFFSGP
ncbi:MAG: hypothetical protein AAGC77_01485 [Pseudomonadota bacterium]